MRKIKYNEYFKKVTDALSNNGGFLTVKTQKNINTMTIGWANIGYIWSKPVLMVAVRKSRYTYKLMENTDDFTVSIPFKDKMKKELAFCGSKSGRDYDKFDKCNLKIQDSSIVNTPIINGCDIHYECELIYQQDMIKENLNILYQDEHYQNDDYHTLYFGEIVNCQIEE